MRSSTCFLAVDGSDVRPYQRSGLVVRERREHPDGRRLEAISVKFLARKIHLLRHLGHIEIEQYAQRQ